MKPADRLLNLWLFGAAAVAWAGAAYVLISLDPRGNGAVLLAGALLLGGGAALTITPLLWLGGFVRARQIAYRGDWWRAARRGALIGLVITIYVVLRGQGVFSLQLVLFVLVMAVLVELTLSLRR
jgi:hypothetical protein